MKAVVLHQIKDLRYEEFPTPSFKGEEVLVSVNSCGICGSDLPRYLRTGSYDMPKILGHEFMGTVAKCGSLVKNIEVGQRVAVIPLIPCRKCDNCQKGMFFHCSSYKFIGSRLHGGWAEYVAVPANNLIPLSDSVSDPAGALLEPITVAYHCVKRMDIQAGQDVVVFGAGAIGILIAQWAKSRGANVMIVDVRSDSLAIAEKCGIKEGIDGIREDVVELIYSKTNCQGADITIEAAGARQSTLNSIQIAANRGKIGLVGRIYGILELSQKMLEMILRKELAIQGLWGFDWNQSIDNDWAGAAEGLSEGKIITEPLVTHTYPLSQASDAIEMMTGGQEYYCKVLLKVEK
jgi:L-iditol 2-dehydrogenase